MQIKQSKHECTSSLGSPVPSAASWTAFRNRDPMVACPSSTQGMAAVPGGPGPFWAWLEAAGNAAVSAEPASPASCDAAGEPCCCCCSCWASSRRSGELKLRVSCRHDCYLWPRISSLAAKEGCTCLRREFAAVRQCQAENPPVCYLTADPPPCCLMLILHEHGHPDD